jgi:hypothetical protein
MYEVYVVCCDAILHISAKPVVTASLTQTTDDSGNYPTTGAVGNNLATGAVGNDPTTGDDGNNSTTGDSGNNQTNSLVFTCNLTDSQIDDDPDSKYTVKWYISGKMCILGRSFIFVMQAIPFQYGPLHESCL